MRKIILLLSLLALLTGCGTVKRMTREEWKVETTRTYLDKSPEEILIAAEKIFRLSDENDYSFAYRDDQVIATRNWMVFAILASVSGVDSWQVSAKRTPEGSTVATAFLSVQYSNQSMVLTTPSPSFATTSFGGVPIDTPWDYRVFWSRMDYLLGVSNTWLDCGSASIQFSKMAPDEDTRANSLCQAITVDDKLPIELRGRK